MKPTIKQCLRKVLSDVAFMWWQVKHPVTAYREWVRVRKAAAAARARFESFKWARRGQP